MRLAHWLRPNKSVQVPTRCFYLDTETKSVAVSGSAVEAQLWFGWACYTRRYRDLKWSSPRWFRFTTPEEFWDWVEGIVEPNRRYYMFAHNLGFDSTVVKTVRCLRDRGWQIKGAIIADPPTILTYKRDKISLVLLDTLNHFRMSLKALGEYVGTAKLTMPCLDDTPDAWDAYCRADVQVLVDAMEGYWEMIRVRDLGNFQNTLASQAFTAYRHRFMKHRILIDSDIDALEMARDAYSGGRVECFRLGAIHEDIYCLDVNSQYPFVMATLDYPTALVAVYVWTNVKDLASWLDTYRVVADVEITTNVPIYPLKHEGRLCFPVGTFRVTLATWELKEAIRLGHISKVYRVAIYESAPIFKEYCEYFYQLRQEAKASGNETEAWLCKLFLNSLYGKFGQRGRVYEDVGTTPDEDAKTWVEWDADAKQIHNMRQFGGVIQEELLEGESRESHPAIAAHVTSAARMHLWNLMVKAGRENVFYCDTDSLMVNEVGLGNLKDSISDYMLGSLKLEWSTQTLVLSGCKDYAYDGVLKIKGIRKTAIELAPGVYQQETFRGLKGMLRAEDMDRLIITTGVKKLSRRYQKGIVYPSGLVGPLSMPLQI